VPETWTPSIYFSFENEKEKLEYIHKLSKILKILGYRSLSDFVRDICNGLVESYDHNKDPYETIYDKINMRYNNNVKKQRIFSKLVNIIAR